MRTLLFVVGSFLVVARAHAQVGPKHYELKRDVYRVELDGTPIARVICTVRDVKSGASDTLIWDPDDRLDNVRYALLPGGRSESPTLACRSSRSPFSSGNTVVFYDSESSQPGEIDLQLRLLSETDAPKGNAGPAPNLKVKITAVDVEERARVLQQRNGAVQTAQLRSLDPTTALVQDALTALTMIAIDRARVAGKEYARQLVLEPLCNELTIAKLSKNLPNNPLIEVLSRMWPQDRRLLQSTCTLVEKLRFDELASARDAVWSAVGVDVSALASAFFEAVLDEPVPELTPILRAASALTTSAMLSSSTTERDAQMLVLSLGRVGSDQPGDWRYSIELGIAVLQECLRTSECSADELQRLFTQEIELHDDAEEELLRAYEWRELLAILGRAADVMRPPPGTPPRTTAANALGVVLDAVDHVVSNIRAEIACKAVGTGKPCGGPANKYTTAVIRRAAVAAPPTEPQDEKQQQTETAARSSRHIEILEAVVAAMRGISAALQGGDVTSAVVALERVFELAIIGECEATQREDCITLSELRRGFRVLAALATYGASYRKPDGETDQAELEKLRTEERRRALESLIDTVTDRSDREQEWIISLGANVALTADYRIVKDDDGDSYVNQLPLSLKTGIAFQYIPARTTPIGFHGMVSALDLAQYAALANTSDDERAAPDPELSTAFRLGAEVGALFGEPSFPILVAAQFGWIPRVSRDERARAEWSASLGVGVFVPFVDFN